MSYSVDDPNELRLLRELEAAFRRRKVSPNYRGKKFDREKTVAAILRELNELRGFPQGQTNADRRK